MYKFFGLVLLSALVAVRAERTNINDELDFLMGIQNIKQALLGSTSSVLPEIPLASKVKYSHALTLGLDSLRRTGDCWQEEKRNEIVIDISYGFGLLALSLPQLEVAGKNMSAYARNLDNSVHLSFTLHHYGDECHAKLNQFRVERLGNVEFGASRPEYDGSNVDRFFKSVVIPALNGIIESNSARIESSLQVLCQ